MRMLKSASFTGTMLALGCLFVANKPADAAVVVTVTEQNGGVLFSATGSLNLSGFAGQSPAGAVGVIYPEINEVSFGRSPDQGFPVTIYYGGITGTSQFSTASYTRGTSGEGIRWGINNNYMFIEDSYTSGSSFTSSLMFSGASFASLGLKQGSYTWLMPHDYVTMSIGNVPLPAALPLLASGIAGLGWLRRRQRKGRNPALLGHSRNGRLSGRPFALGLVTLRHPDLNPAVRAPISALRAAQSPLDVHEQRVIRLATLHLP